MGMPITTYNVLNALDKGEPEYEIQAAQKALEPFNLFAFIIHDPEAHPDFDRKLSSMFNWLDHITGSELLFFALADPPEEWLNQGRNRGRDRPYYRELSSLNTETQELLNPENTIISPDRSITAFSLANSLEIPYDNLPCLVITPDFRSEHFIWVRTCPDHVEEQLTQLGYIARQIVQIPPEPAFLEWIKTDIDLCKGGRIQLLVSSIAKRLVNVMSCFIARDNSEAYERAQNTINELRTNLRELKKDINEHNTDENESDREKLDNLCLQIILSLSHLNLVDPSGISRSNTLNLDNIIVQTQEFLENDSYIMLKTANMVLNSILDSQHSLGFDVDYTPGVICLAKVFEREVNLSVVHWMRSELGVRLPLYFNRFDPKKKATFDGVNFNRSHDSKIWSPPTMGRSLEAVNRKVGAREQRPHPRELYNKWFQFLREWGVITNERNTAAHTMELVDEKSVRTVCQALETLSSYQIFENLWQLKCQYRS